MLIVKLLVALACVHTVFGQCRSSRDKYIGDLCYTISSQKLSFLDAQSACYRDNENLAVIHTTLQANFLASSVRSETGAPEQKFWIGLSRPSASSRFQWDDGTSMYWSNFDGNFPKDNNFVAESTVNGKWQTLDGAQNLYFVCSYDPRGVNPSTPGYPTDSPYTTGYPVSYPTSDNTDQTWQPSYTTDYPGTDRTWDPSYTTETPGTDQTWQPSYTTDNPGTDETWDPSYTTEYPGTDQTWQPSYTTEYPGTDRTWDPSYTTETPGTDQTWQPSYTTEYPGTDRTWDPSYTTDYPGTDETVH